MAAKRVVAAQTGGSHGELVMRDGKVKVAAFRTFESGTRTVPQPVDAICELVCMSAKPSFRGHIMGRYATNNPGLLHTASSWLHKRPAVPCSKECANQNVMGRVQWTSRTACAGREVREGLLDGRWCGNSDTATVLEEADPPLSSSSSLHPKNTPGLANQ